jgi:hypothetical protein
MPIPFDGSAAHTLGVEMELGLAREPDWVLRRTDGAQPGTASRRPWSTTTDR